MKTTPPSASEIDSGRVEGEGVRGEVLRRAMRAGIEYYRGIQDDDGHWASDYGGPMFLMPGLIIAARVMGKTEEIIGERRRVEMLRYLENHLNEDGGWGYTSRDTTAMLGAVLRVVGASIARQAVERARVSKGEEMDHRSRWGDAGAVVGEVLARRARRVRMEWTQPVPPGVGCFRIGYPCTGTILVSLSHGLPSDELSVRYSRHGDAVCAHRAVEE